MSVQLINRANGLTVVALNSGESIHLAPGETSRPIGEFEIKDNAKLHKLLERNLIVTTGTAGASSGGGGKDTKKKKGA